MGIRLEGVDYIVYCPLNMLQPTIHKMVLSLSRAHFREAHEAWKQYGPLSDLYVIIIDEIDAICKPRGGCGSI